MAWITLTRDDILSKLSEPEAKALESAAKKAGTNPLAEIMAEAVNNARSDIANNPKNTLAAGETIPERAKGPLLAIIRHNLLTRVDMAVSEARAREYKDAVRWFERVADGDVAIEQPEGETAPASEQASGAGISWTNKPKRVNTRQSLSGL
jgi:phage gp36-like protein